MSVSRDRGGVSPESRSSLTHPKETPKEKQRKRMAVAEWPQAAEMVFDHVAGFAELSVEGRRPAAGLSAPRPVGLRERARSRHR
jgi:hypothetical protein